MTRLFTFADAVAIAAAPHIARAFQAEAARAAAHTREAAEARGKSQHLEPHTPRPDAALSAAGEAACQRARRHADSPRGRLMRAVRELEAGFVEPAEAVRAAYARGLAEPGHACPDEVGRALAALAGLDHPAAREAGRALLDILMESAPAAAE